MVIPVSQKEMDELINKKAHDKMLEAFSMLGYLTSIHGPNKLKDIIDTIVRANEYAYKLDSNEEEIDISMGIPIFTHLNEQYGIEGVKQIIKHYEEKARAEAYNRDRIAALEKEIAELKE